MAGKYSKEAKLIEYYNFGCAYLAEERMTIGSFCALINRLFP
jgi:uncharacterized protein YutD